MENHTLEMLVCSKLDSAGLNAEILDVYEEDSVYVISCSVSYPEVVYGGVNLVLVNKHTREVVLFNDFNANLFIQSYLASNGFASDLSRNYNGITVAEKPVSLVTSLSNWFKRIFILLQF